MPRIITFEKAVADAKDKCDDLAVLLGNGFSIDYAPDVFNYDSLADEALLAGLSVPKRELFDSLASSNFEVVIEKLRTGAALERLYGGKESIAKKMESDARVVRNGLADALADRHPNNSLELSDDEVFHARTFLSNFDRIFTLSYDLLLYWVLNRSGPPHALPRRDGFEWPSRRDKSRLIWKSKPSYQQTVFFVHGALHLFVENNRVRKLSYRADGPLIDGLREHLSAGHYPLVVTEGAREEKEARIEKSAYLRTGLRRFGALKGALFVHGASMSPNDDHILELVESDTSEVDALYVGVRDPASRTGRILMERASDVTRRRKEGGGRNLRLRFYQANSANVWRDQRSSDA